MKASDYFLQLARRAGTLVGLSYAFILLVVAPFMLVSTVASFVFVALVVSSASGGGLISEFGGDRIVVVPVRGEIVGAGQSSSDASAASVDGYAVKDRLKELAGDDSVKGVMLEIDSPGGSIAGARAIADGVAEYRRDAKRPITTYVAGSADSGAYWAAASTDHVTADHGTDVGDIGVILGPFDSYRGVTSKSDVSGDVTAASINQAYITAGTGKDAGNPYRPLTPEETANFQRGVDNVYGEFVDFVADRRGLTATAIRNQVKAFAYDPATALELKLIDAVGGRDEATTTLAARAGLSEGDYTIDRDEVPTPAGEFYGESAIRKLSGAAAPVLKGLETASRHLLGR